MKVLERRSITSVHRPFVSYVGLFLRKGENPSIQRTTSRNKDKDQQQTQSSSHRVRESNPCKIGGRRVISSLCHPCSPFLTQIPVHSFTPWYYFLPSDWLRRYMNVWRGSGWSCNDNCNNESDFFHFCINHKPKRKFKGNWTTIYLKIKQRL